MSYNISNHRIRSLTLTFPLTFDFQAWLREQPDKRQYDNVGKKWCLQGKNRVLVDLAAQTWELGFGGQSLSGVFEDNQLVTKELSWSSDGSGHMFTDILLPLFESFQGDLDGLFIWESGDSVEDVKIQKGVVTRSEVV